MASNGIDKSVEQRAQQTPRVHQLHLCLWQPAAGHVVEPRLLTSSKYQLESRGAFRNDYHVGQLQ